RGSARGLWLGRAVCQTDDGQGQNGSAVGNRGRESLLSSGACSFRNRLRRMVGESSQAHGEQGGRMNGRDPLPIGSDFRQMVGPTASGANAQEKYLLIATDSGVQGAHSGYTQLARHIEASSLVWRERRETGQFFERVANAALRRMSGSRWYKTG